MVTKWKERRVEETKKMKEKWTAGLTEGKWRAEDAGWDGGAREEEEVRWTDEEEEKGKGNGRYGTGL